MATVSSAEVIGFRLRLNVLYQISGSLPVSVFSDDGAIDPLPDLSIPILNGEGIADIPSGVVIGGLILPRSGGADHIKAGHSVRFVWYALVYRISG
jgi:hypothetical protein